MNPILTTPGSFPLTELIIGSLVVLTVLYFVFKRKFDQREKAVTDRINKSKASMGFPKTKRTPPPPGGVVPPMRKTRKHATRENTQRRTETQRDDGLDLMDVIAGAVIVDALLSDDEPHSDYTPEPTYTPAPDPTPDPEDTTDWSNSSETSSSDDTTDWGGSDDSSSWDDD